MDKQTENYVGRAVLDRNGQQVGLVDHAHEASDHGDPGWVVVSTGRGRRDLRVVPLRGAATDGPDIVLPFNASVVYQAPSGKIRAHMTFAEESNLREYYDAATAAAGPAPGIAESTAPVRPDPGLAPAPPPPPVAPPVAPAVPAGATTGHNAMIVPAGSSEVLVGDAKAPAKAAEPPANLPQRSKRRPLRRRFLGGPR